MCVPKVKPEGDSGSISYLTLCHGFKLDQIVYIGLPPEGANQLISRKLSIAVVGFPYYLNPGDIFSVKKLVKILEEKTIVLYIDVENSQPTLVFGSANS